MNGNDDSSYDMEVLNRFSFFHFFIILINLKLCC